MEIKYRKCAKCGQIVSVIKDTGVPIICCGQPMEAIEANVVDAAVEKHVPVYENSDNMLRVNIGIEDHPMTEEHYIEWIACVTKFGYQRKNLKPGDVPHAVFSMVDGDEVVAVYAYCNLHGLWKK